MSQNTSTTHKLPLTGGDLRAIADVADLMDTPGVQPLAGSPLIGRIEVYRPDGDSAEVIGHLVPYDDWFGFEFAGS